MELKPKGYKTRIIDVQIEKYLNILVLFALKDQNGVEKHGHIITF